MNFELGNNLQKPNFSHLIFLKFNSTKYLILLAVLAHLVLHIRYMRLIIHYIKKNTEKASDKFQGMSSKIYRLRHRAASSKKC